MAAAYVQVRVGARHLSIVARSLILGHQGLFRAAGQDARDRHPTARTITPKRRHSTFLELFSHASESDVAERQRPASQHTEVAMRSLQPPSKPDFVDASIRGGPHPLTARAGCGVRDYRVTTPEYLSGRPRTSAPHLYRLDSSGVLAGDR
jgi:hypothetical protein